MTVHILPFRAKACHVHYKRGIVLVAVIVVLAISLTLFGVWAKRVLREQSRLSSEQVRMQAIRLAEAGVERALLRRAAEPEYREETWTVPAAQLDKTHTAKVRMQISPGSSASMLRCKAIAEYPAGAVRHVQITKSIEFPSPLPVAQP